jgi:hypothetical protein
MTQSNTTINAIFIGEENMHSTQLDNVEQIFEGSSVNLFAAITGEEDVAELLSYIRKLSPDIIFISPDYLGLDTAEILNGKFPTVLLAEEDNNYIARGLAPIVDGYASPNDLLKDQQLALEVVNSAIKHWNEGRISTDPEK